MSLPCGARPRPDVPAVRARFPGSSRALLPIAMLRSRLVAAGPRLGAGAALLRGLQLPPVCARPGRSRAPQRGAHSDAASPGVGAASTGSATAPGTGAGAAAAAAVAANHAHLHSHAGPGGHTHTHGSAQLLSSGGGWRNPGVRITWLGLLANVSMAIGKGVGGVVFHSQSLLADAVHAAADLVSDFVTLATIKYVRSPPSRFFPDGYGRIEAMGTLGVSTLLLYAGASMGLTSFQTLSQAIFGHAEWLEWLQVVFGHGHSHGGSSQQIAEWSAAWIAIGSIVIKEALFQATYRIGKRENSTVLVANAWHHRVDSLASIVAAASVAGGQILGVCWLDPLGGAIVSFMVVRAGWQPFKQSFSQLIGSNRELMESPTFDEFKAKTEESIAAISDKYTITDLMLIPHGTTYAAYLHLAQARGLVHGPETTLAAANKVATQLQHDLLEQDPDLRQVHVTIGSPTAKSESGGAPANH